MNWTPTVCTKCGTTTGGLFTVCPICKAPVPANVSLHPALSHKQALSISRDLGLTLGQTRAAFAHRLHG